MRTPNIRHIFQHSHTVFAKHGAGPVSPRQSWPFVLICVTVFVLCTLGYTGWQLLGIMRGTFYEGSTGADGVGAVLDSNLLEQTSKFFDEREIEFIRLQSELPQMPDPSG